MGVNKVILIGNVGKDPEIKDINGTKCASFSLATSETYKDKKGEKATNTQWHNIVIWRNLADVAEKYVKKGDKLYLEGKIENRSYEKNGETKYFTQIVVNVMQMLGSKSESNGNSQKPTTKPDLPVESPESDDLPF